MGAIIKSVGRSGKILPYELIDVRSFTARGGEIDHTLKSSTSDFFHILSSQFSEKFIL
jgi:hypothetical protein